MVQGLDIGALVGAIKSAVGAPEQEIDSRRVAHGLAKHGPETLALALIEAIKRGIADAHPASPPTMADSDTRTHISTEEAARMLGRQPQTLRGWACSDSGLLRPVRAGARLMWSVDEIKALLSAPKGPKAKVAA